MNILAAREKKCPICDGIVYKLKTELGVFYQCSNCGCMHK